MATQQFDDQVKHLKTKALKEQTSSTSDDILDLHKTMLSKK